jgi:hypothetical protein
MKQKFKKIKPQKKLVLEQKKLKEINKASVRYKAGDKIDFISYEKVKQILLRKTIQQ